MKIFEHPMKEGVKRILNKHFTTEIANRFKLHFESDHIAWQDSEHIFKQMRDGHLVLEVRYVTPAGTNEFVCDLYSWVHPTRTEARLLRYITDCVKAGKFGADWDMSGEKISGDIRSGKLETPDDGPLAFNLETPNIKLVREALRNKLKEEEKKKGVKS